MVDLHSHVLYGIDDGAEDIEESIKILKEAKRAGIDKIIMTPHFEVGEDVNEFIERRNKNAARLIERAKAEDVGIDIKCGAEVYITDEIYNEGELSRLCMGESETVLCEFKYHNLRRETFLGYIDEILDSGLDILIAHVERYSYIRNDRWLFEKLLERGVKLQINAISLFEDSPEGDFAAMLVKNHLVYAIGGDVHRQGARRMAAMEKVIRDGRFDKLLCDNPMRIFERG